jgi:hypothetical protein
MGSVPIIVDIKPLAINALCRSDNEQCPHLCASRNIAWGDGVLRVLRGYAPGASLCYDHGAMAMGFHFFVLYSSFCVLHSL